MVRFADGVEFFDDGFVDFFIGSFARGAECDFKGEMDFFVIFHDEEIMIIQRKSGAINGRLQVSTIFFFFRIGHRLRVCVHHCLHLQFFTEHGHHVLRNLMASHEAQGTIELYVGGGEMILRAVIVDDEVVDAVNAGTSEDTFLDFLIETFLRRSAQDGIHSVAHDGVAGPQDEKRHQDAHDAIDLDFKEIFYQRGRQYAGCRKHIRERVGAVSQEGIGGKPAAGSLVPPSEK